MRKNLFLFCLFLFFTGCSVKQNLKNPQILELEFEQNATILQTFGNETRKEKDEFLNRYFKVWDSKKPDVKQIKKLQKSVFWGLTYAKNANLRFDKFGNNYDENFLNSINFNANTDEFATLWQPGITIKNTLLRNIPSDSEIYANPASPGEGYPFDYAANSALSVAYPVLVSHFSVDKKWVFVQNDAVWGWIKSEDIKFLDENQIQIYKNSNFLTILQDGVELKNQNNEVILNTRIGGVLPFDFQNQTHFSGILPNNQRYFIDKFKATVFPAKMNDENIKNTINSLLGQNYGWGGIDFLRDCSLLTKDFFATFGIWLPRNSKAQSNNGEKLNISHLSNSEKLDFIKQNGVAYKTLIYKNGHIMLYVGLIDEKVGILHDMWGLKTLDGKRAVAGKTVLTTLEIGQERQDIATNNLLISQISAITILE